MDCADRDALLSQGPYTQSRTEKHLLFTRHLTRLTAHHWDRCPPYHRLLQALGCGKEDTYPPETVPMLPVMLFKEMDLRSISEDKIFKVLTSSGTTGQRVSRICLDAETSASQQRALCHIMGDLLGPERLPLLILDSKSVLKDRAMFSARGAGILGFSLFASRSCYALDEEMRLDLAGIRRFLSEHRGERIFLFGFTYMIWKHVILPLEAMGEQLELSNGILIHGGGWKKLKDQAVPPQVFRDRCRAATGAAVISDYYGMAEQTGSIYLACPYGHLHASVWSDVLFRRPGDFSLCAPGEPGLLESISLLPESYPGHALLTEDIGVLLGEDDCPCGRMGKYFSVIGRVPRAEIRGCSDTYEG